MEYLIAESFTDSLARLTAEEQKLAKTTAFDLQLNPATPGFSFHKLDKAKDKNFWSVRVGSDLRMIVHRTDSSLLLCYVGHHDTAYRWAERRKLEVHPRTGAAQLVEIRERVQEVTVLQPVLQTAAPTPKSPLFGNISDDALLGYGVPEEWLSGVRAATEDTFLELFEHLPGEAGEVLFAIATGGTPPVPPPVAAVIDPFAHPDAQRRFRVMNNREELALALEFPWEKWTVFLHPAQRELVERDFGGPARVSGSAGTGKSIVALHRAVFLAKTDPESRVLLTTFSETLANALRTKLRRLIGAEPRLGERIEIHSMDAIGRRLFELKFGKAKLVTRDHLDRCLVEIAAKVEGASFGIGFLRSEWEQVVDAWQLDSWESYRDVARLGRKTRLPEARRRILWSIFEQLRFRLAAEKLVTMAEMFSRVAAGLLDTEKRPFDHCVVDEAQDVNVPQLRFLAAMGAGRPNGLFFAGDLGQRIFQQPFSWKALGVDVRGRSKTLRINYRTSHQIRVQADRLLGPELSDVDGNAEDRRGAMSVFNGAAPSIVITENPEREAEVVAGWLAERVAEGIKSHEIGIFVRSAKQLDRARATIERVGLPFRVLDENVDTTIGQVSIGTMHLAKGLEFRVVVVMAVDDEVVPLMERIESVTDDADLREVYDTERHLLYVACTRARDYLLVSSGDAPSEFLEDLRG